MGWTVLGTVVSCLAGNEAVFVGLAQGRLLDLDHGAAGSSTLKAALPATIRAALPAVAGRFALHLVCTASWGRRTAAATHRAHFGHGAIAGKASIPPDGVPSFWQGFSAVLGSGQDPSGYRIERAGREGVSPLDEKTHDSEPGPVIGQLPVVGG